MFLKREIYISLFIVAFFGSCYPRFLPPTAVFYNYSSSSNNVDFDQVAVVCLVDYFILHTRLIYGPPSHLYLSKFSYRISMAHTLL